jgi:DNA-binding Lrp family transcriptional regulator
MKLAWIVIAVEDVLNMTLAFVLINVQSGTEEEVLKEIKKLPNVTEVYAVYGIYDLLVRIEADTLEKIKGTVDLGVRKISKVRSSITMIVVEKHSTR